MDEVERQKYKLNKYYIKFQNIEERDSLAFARVRRLLKKIDILEKALK